MINFFQRISLILVILFFAVNIGMAAAETKDTPPPQPQPPDELAKKAEKGDAVAQRELGLFYRNHDYADLKTRLHYQDIANEWLKKAATKGDSQAQYIYGSDFCGQYYAMNKPDECLGWLGKAAKQGNAEAQGELGILYLHGGRTRDNAEAVKKDVDKAVEFLKKAAAQSDSAAMYHLGNAYMQAKQDPKAALEWYHKAAELWETGAMVTLADMYLRGTPQLDKNTPKALSLYAEAADLFDMDAKFALAHIYMRGEVMPKDFKKAAAFFRQIDENDDLVNFEDNNMFAELVVDAKLHLGLMYRDGLGVDKDEKEALLFFRQAERFDSQDAQYLIGQAYEKGSGVARNFVEAYVWYARANNDFRDFWLDIIDGPDTPRHLLPDSDPAKALEALTAKMTDRDLVRAKRYVKEDNHTREQLDSALRWHYAP